MGCGGGGHPRAAGTPGRPAFCLGTSNARHPSASRGGASGASRALRRGRRPARTEAVVECDVDGGDGGGEGAPALEVLRAVHLLPQRTDPHPVLHSKPPRRQRRCVGCLWGCTWGACGSAPHLADEELGVVVDGTRDGELAPGEAGLAPAEHAALALHLDQADVARALCQGGSGCGKRGGGGRDRGHLWGWARGAPARWGSTLLP